MLLLGLTAIYLLRNVVIAILFSPDFYPMENLFVWQLIGDFFKICSWLLAFLMIAKSMTKTYIVIEVFFSVSFVALGFFFMSLNGVVGLTQAYLVNYVLYLICIFLLFRRVIFI